MWHGAVNFVITFLWSFLQNLLLYFRQRERHTHPQGSQSQDTTPEKDDNQSQAEEWEVIQTPNFRYQLSVVASQLLTVGVMSPTLNLAPTKLIVYFTQQHQKDQSSEEVTHVTVPQMTTHDRTGEISITSQPIQKQKAKSCTLCGLSTVHSTVDPSSATHLDHQHPWSIALTRPDLQAHSASLLCHWTKVLEQFSPTLKNLIEGVMMVNHSFTHGHQDYHPKKVTMRLKKQYVPYQVPSLAFVPASPVSPMTPSLPTPPQTRPPTPPSNWIKGSCTTPVILNSTSASEDELSQTSSASSSRSQSPDSGILAPRYPKYRNQGRRVLDLK